MITTITFFAVALTAWILPVTFKIKRIIYRRAEGDSRAGAKTFSPVEILYVLPVMAALLSNEPAVMFGTAAAVFLTVFGVLFISRPKASEKLVYTPEIQRLLGITYAAYWLVAILGVYIGGTYSTGAAVIWLTAFAVLPPALVKTAGWINEPIERKVQQRAVEDAERLLGTMPELTVVTVSGSGSAEMLGNVSEVLAERFQLLTSSTSNGTKLETARIINKELKSYHDLFLTEIKTGEEKAVQEIFRAAGRRIIIYSGEKLPENMYESIPEKAVLIADRNAMQVYPEKVQEKDRLVTFALDRQDADIYAEGVEEETRGIHFTVKQKSHHKSFPVYSDSRETARLTLAAAAAALEMGMTSEEIEKAIKKRS
jgi:UDP-N-acetylmuramoyl-tripeptide--D-alanyl-D-alanine ligase